MIKIENKLNKIENNIKEQNCVLKQMSKKIDHLAKK